MTTPVVTSRATHTSSSTWRSRLCLPAGLASAPSITGTTRRSPTTWAPRSTSSRWSLATWVTISGTGVAFTRDPNTGEKVLFGEYLTNAQGEDVVAGHPDRAQDQPDADGHAGGLCRVPANWPAARAALPRCPGPRIHDRAGQAVHAPDPLGQADCRRRGEDRGRYGRRGDHHAPRGGVSHRARARGPVAPRPRSTRSAPRARSRSSMASTRHRAPPWGERCSTPMSRSSGSIAASE